MKLPWRRSPRAGADYCSTTAPLKPDPLLAEVDLTRFAPYRETGRWLVTWQGGLGPQYGLVVVYTGKRGRTVHVVHSPGYKYGNTLQTHSEHLAAQIKRRDPLTTAILLSWPTDMKEVAHHDELARVIFAGTPLPVEEDDDGDIAMYEDDPALQHALRTFPVGGSAVESYRGRHTVRRLSPGEWGDMLETGPLVRFSYQSWIAAADELDPDRDVRSSVELASESAGFNLHAWFSEVEGGDDA